MTAARRVRFWLLGLVLFLIAVYLLRSILLPFVAGMAIGSSAPASRARSPPSW